MIVFIKNISIYVYKQGKGFPLIVLLELDRNTLSVFREMTQVSDGVTVLELTQEEVVANCFVMSEFLRDVFADLDTSSERLHLVFDNQNGLEFHTRSQYGEIETKIRKGSSALSNFHCTEVLQFTYPISMIKHALKVLGQSKKTCIKVSQQGLLSLQYQIYLKRRIQVYVEYVCTPTIDPL